MLSSRSASDHDDGVCEPARNHRGDKTSIESAMAWCTGVSDGILLDVVGRMANEEVQTKKSGN